MRARAFLSALVTCALLTLCLALGGCSMSRRSRLLAVGGSMSSGRQTAAGCRSQNRKVQW